MFYLLIDAWLCNWFALLLSISTNCHGASHVAIEKDLNLRERYDEHPSRLNSHISNRDHNIRPDQSNSLNNSAFCRPLSRYRARYFPTDVPEHHMPWIWDAVYDLKTGIVDITSMSRNPCNFNRNQWHEIVHLHPTYSNQFGYGLTSNIHVPVDNNVTKRELHYLLDDSVICEFIKDGKIAFTSESLPIRGKKSFIAISTMQIRCPVKDNSYLITWESVRIRLKPDRREYKTTIFSDRSPSVPVCVLPDYDNNQKKYKVSLCTATSRSDREHLVEWIEYHKLIGVEHIYVYNTAISSDESKRLFEALSDYIHEDYVTIIPWPFTNCVRYMAGGRWTTYSKPGDADVFKPPRAISQTAALASCYTRFRHTSKYMIHIDDDEYLVFSSERVKSILRAQIMPETLFDLAEMIFSYYPHESAIRFEPVVYLPCNKSQGIEHTQQNVIKYPSGSVPEQIRTPLPRLGVWDVGYATKKFESKLLLRTDVVGMYFVHFVLYSERGYQDTSFSLPLMALSMIHYKYPSSLSKSALESTLPIQSDAFEQECQSLYDQVSSSRRRQSFHAQISSNISNQLKRNYLQRITRRI